MQSRKANPSHHSKSGSANSDNIISEVESPIPSILKSSSDTDANEQKQHPRVSRSTIIPPHSKTKSFFGNQAYKHYNAKNRKQIKYLENQVKRLSEGKKTASNSPENFFQQLPPLQPPPRTLSQASTAGLIRSQLSSNNPSSSHRSSVSDNQTMLHSNPANSRTAFSTAASPGFFEKQQEITAEQIAKEFENNNPSFDHHFRKDRLSEKDRVTITEVADLLLKERLRRYKTHPGINDPHNTDKYEIMSSEIATLINLAIALSSTTRSPENTTKINRAINGLVGAILHPKEELSVNWKLALCASLVTGCMIFISLFIPWITGLSVVNLLASQFLGIPMSSVLISAPLWLGKAIEYFFFSPSTIQIKIRQIEEVSKDVSATEASISVLRDEVADLLTKAEHTQSILKEADALEKIKALQVSLCSLEKRHEEGRERTKDLRYIYSILASVKELLSQWTSPTKARDMQENTLEVFLNEMHGAVSLVPVKEGTIRSILTTYILPAAPVVLFLLLVGGLFCGSYGIIGLSTNMTFLGTQALFWLKDVISAITPSKEGAASLISQKINATEAQNIMPDLIKTIRKSTKIGDSKVYRVETVPHSSASESSSSYVKLLRIPLSSTAAPALAVSDAAKLSRRKSGQRHRSSAISSHNAQSTSDHSPSSRRSSR